LYLQQSRIQFGVRCLPNGAVAFDDDVGSFFTTADRALQQCNQEIGWPSSLARRTFRRSVCQSVASQIENGMHGCDCNAKCEPKIPPLCSVADLLQIIPVEMGQAHSSDTHLDAEDSELEVESLGLVKTTIATDSDDAQAQPSSWISSSFRGTDFESCEACCCTLTKEQRLYGEHPCADPWLMRSVWS
jgi:hypothetical protein